MYGDDVVLAEAEEYGNLGGKLELRRVASPSGLLTS